MSGVLDCIRSILRRRRLQAALVAVIAAVVAGLLAMALTFYFLSNSQFYSALDRLRGADLLVAVPAASISDDELQATAFLMRDVTATSGPWLDAEVVFDRGVPDSTMAQVRVAGRLDTDGPVDRIDLVDGRWVRGGGEVVLSSVAASQLGVHVGDRIVAGASPGRPSLGVVGIAADLGSQATGVQRAWVSPDQVSPLVQAGSVLNKEIAYRFQNAQLPGALDREFAELRALLPSDIHPIAVESSHDLKGEFNRLIDPLTTGLFPLSGFTLVMGTLLIFNIVSGVVLTSYRDTGIMKAVGVSSRQVAVVYLSVVVLPATAGGLAGACLGGLGALRVIALSQRQFGIGLPVATAAAAALAALGLVLLTTLLASVIPVIRAARIPAITAMYAGATPPAKGRAIGRVMPSWFGTPARIGLEEALVRPLRSGLTAIAIMVAVLTGLYALQARTNLLEVDHDLRQERGDVTVFRYGAFPDDLLMSRLRAQPETRAVVAAQTLWLDVGGIQELTRSIAMRGDTAGRGYAMVTGRWYAGPGEAVVSNGFLRLAHLKLDDAFDATIVGPQPQSVRLRVVGTYLDLDGFGRIIRFDASSLKLGAPGTAPQQYSVQLRPGADPATYARRIQGSELLIRASVPALPAWVTIELWSVTAAPVAVALIGLLGAINTVLLNARERVLSIAILKAVGMTRRQVLTMTIVSGAALGLVGAIAGLPLGIAALGLGSAFTASQYQVAFPPGWLAGPGSLTAAVLVLAGVGLAALGAILPGRWAARLPIAQLLRTE